jgi:hypothetical protein
MILGKNQTQKKNRHAEKREKKTATKPLKTAN